MKQNSILEFTKALEDEKETWVEAKVEEYRQNLDEGSKDADDTSRIEALEEEYRNSIGLEMEWERYVEDRVEKYALELEEKEDA